MSVIRPPDAILSESGSVLQSSSARLTPTPHVAGASGSRAKRRRIYASRLSSSIHSALQLDRLLNPRAPLLLSFCDATFRDPSTTCASRGWLHS